MATLDRSYRAEQRRDSGVDQDRSGTSTGGNGEWTDPETAEDVRVKIRASLDAQTELLTVHDWLNRWKPVIRSCQKSGGVWDERYEVVVPAGAVRELPDSLIHQLSLSARSATDREFGDRQESHREHGPGHERNAPNVIC